MKSKDYEPAMRLSAALRMSGAVVNERMCDLILDVQKAMKRKGIKFSIGDAVKLELDNKNKWNESIAIKGEITTPAKSTKAKKQK